MSFGEAIKTFSGRARRSEFWYFYLFYILVAFGLSFLSIWIPFAKYLYTLFGLGVFLPYTAVTVRRLHDIGKSGWILLIFMVISLLISMLLFLFIDIITPTNALFMAYLSSSSLHWSFGLSYGWPKTANPARTNGGPTRKKFKVKTIQE